MVCFYREANRAPVTKLHPTISLPENHCAISTTAVSGPSEPCAEFSLSDTANSLRSVPGAAFAGSVAPSTSRYFLIASSASSTCTTTGPAVMVSTSLPKNGRSCIKSLRLLARHPDALLRDDAQSRLFDQRVDRPGEVSLRCIRLQNRKSAFDRHDVPRVKKANINRRFIADTAGRAKAQLALGAHADSFQSKSPASSARTGS